MYQCKVDVDMLNAVKSVLSDVLSVSPSSEQRAISITLPYICYVMTRGIQMFGLQLTYFKGLGKKCQKFLS